jgi:hypothetical protein
MRQATRGRPQPPSAASISRSRWYASRWASLGVRGTTTRISATASPRDARVRRANPGVRGRPPAVERPAAAAQAQLAAARGAGRHGEIDVAVERAHAHAAAEDRDVVGDVGDDVQRAALEPPARVRRVPHHQQKVAATRRLPAQAQLGAVAHPGGDADLQRLAVDPHAHGPAVEGALELDLQGGLDGAGPRRLARAAPANGSSPYPPVANGEPPTPPPKSERKKSLKPAASSGRTLP